MGIFSAMGSVFGRRNKRQDNSGMNDLIGRVSALEQAGSTAGIPPAPVPEVPATPESAMEPSMDPVNVQPDNLAIPANMQGGKPQSFATAQQQQVGNALFQQQEQY